MYSVFSANSSPSSGSAADLPDIGSQQQLQSYQLSPVTLLGFFQYGREPEPEASTNENTIDENSSRRQAGMRNPHDSFPLGLGLTSYNVLHFCKPPTLS